MRSRKPQRPLNHEPVSVTYARKKAGLTLTQLAGMCGVSVSLISEIEAGTRNATDEMLNKLATALNCPRVVLEAKRVPQTAETADVEVPDLRNAERADTDDLPERIATPEVEREAS